MSLQMEEQEISEIAIRIRDFGKLSPNASTLIGVHDLYFWKNSVSVEY
jgi:hypothetical protein